MQRKALGKGLDALIKENVSENKGKAWITNIPLSKIDASSLQPRKNFTKEELENLSASIKDKGVLQPVLVRKTGDRFELIAGERRFRSAKLADIKSIPAVVKQVSDEELLQLSLIENVQRENLTPVEEALAYKQLHDDYGFSQQEVAEKVSKSRSAISNYLRLLTLPKGVLKKIDSGVISFGHAKAILGCESQRRQEKIAHLIEKKGLSVRETENLVSKKERSVSKNKFSEDKKKSPEIKNIEEKLSKKIGTKIKISCGRKKGKVEIEFYSDKDLERIFDILMK